MSHKSLILILLITPLMTACYSPLGPFRRIPPTPIPTLDPVIGKFCGGVNANAPENQCPDGYYCLKESGYPDAGGTCQQRTPPTQTPTPTPEPE